MAEGPDIHQPDSGASPSDASRASAPPRVLHSPGTGKLAATLVVGVVIGVLVGYSLSSSETRQYRQEAATAREELATLARAHETLQERNWILYLELQDSQTQGQDEEAEVPPGVYADGTYEVGTDIAPGTYKGDVTGDFGYWARLNNTSGMVSGIEANAVVRGPFVVTIVSSDVAVELRGVTLTAAE